MKRFIFGEELARALEVPEDRLFEMAHACQLPFIITTRSPRRIAIEAVDLPAWRNALEKAS